jgi:hypothetical protein
MKARRWLDRALQRGSVRAKDIHFSLDRLVDAVIESADLEMEIR